MELVRVTGECLNYGVNRGLVSVRSVELGRGTFECLKYGFGTCD
jgi:hypothetical protein